MTNAGLSHAGPGHRSAKLREIQWKVDHAADQACIAFGHDSEFMQHAFVVDRANGEMESCQIGAGSGVQEGAPVISLLTFQGRTLHARHFRRNRDDWTTARRAAYSSSVSAPAAVTVTRNNQQTRIENPPRVCTLLIAD